MGQRQVLKEVHNILQKKNNDLVMKPSTFLITLIISLFGMNSFAQKLTRLYDVENSYFNDSTQRRVLPDFDIELDIDNKLYYKGNLKFDPSGEFNYCIYELFNNRFIVITALSEKNRNSSLVYALPKNKVTIIDLQNWDMNYKTDLDAKLIYDIYIDYDNNDKEIIVIKAIDKIHKYKLEGSRSNGTD